MQFQQYKIRHFDVIFTSFLRHFYVINTHSSLHIITSLLRQYYVINTSLLLIIRKSLLPIITSLILIITSLLRHCYKWRYCVIMSLLLPIITLAVSIKIPLLHIIAIITYYYLFET